MQLVYCSCPADRAGAIARQLVEERLAACVSILPGVQSVYRWQGAIEQASESLLLIKTACYPALQTRLTALHPYELPEILAVSVSDGLPAYIDWVHESTTQE